MKIAFALYAFLNFFWNFHLRVMIHMSIWFQFRLSLFHTLTYFCFFFILPDLWIEELQNVRESESKYKQQHIEALKREKMLIRRLAAKEQEMQEYVVRNLLPSHLKCICHFECVCVWTMQLYKWSLFINFRIKMLNWKQHKHQPWLHYAPYYSIRL